MTTSATQPAASQAPSRRPMIEVEHLTKQYGAFTAVEDVNFTARAGEILGFLGPNGAGKTTTMRILTGFMPPTSGAARIAGFDTVEQSKEARRRLGYLPEYVPLYTDMTIRSYLEYMGALRDMDRKRLKRRVDEAMELVQVTHYRDTLISKLSKGYRQRVGIAQAILHEPQVLILDEPTIGIDPTQVVETRQLIKGLGGDHTVLLSTHILPEVSMVCQRVVIINEGRIVADGAPNVLAKRLEGVERYEVEVRGPTAEVTKRLQAVEGVTEVTWEKREDGAVFLVSAEPGTRIYEKVTEAIVSGGWGLVRLQPVAMTLEEIFLKLTTEDIADGA